jgi:imidazolonepropionase
MPKSPALLLTNIGQLLTLRSTKSGPRRGTSLSDLGIIEDAALLCLGGKIVSVGTMKHAARDPWLRKNRKQVAEVDCGGRVVLPGFVDSHTHPVFVNPRLVDFEKRIAGASYEEIAEAGGGIRSSLDGVRQASQPALTQKVLAVLRDMAKHGTTTVEAKSGYGLSLESELKSLQSIAAAAKQWPGTAIATFLGAHVVPPKFCRRSQSTSTSSVKR